MNRSRVIGVILIASGIVVAAAAGLSLAFSAVQGQSANTVLTNAGIVFLPIAVLVGAGIYQFVRGSHDIEDDSEMRQQLQMMDILKTTQEPMRMADLAAQLGVGVENIGTMMNDLIRLKLFSGRVDWQSREVQAINPDTLRSINACVRCGEPLRLHQNTVCPQCGTEYFLPEG